LADYRLDELARLSGVSARNIRAYRERGLLDPPRRVGRSAYYDDYHLAQLQTINQLLRKGFNSTHIAEFFASTRKGDDLAGALGIRRAILGARRQLRAEPAQVWPSGQPAMADRPALDSGPDGAEARRLLEVGLAEVVHGAVVLVDPTMAAIVARASDQSDYAQAILQIFHSTRETTEQLATAVVTALEQCVSSRFGPNFLPKPDEMAEVSRIVQDYRDLANRVVARHLDEALHQQMVAGPSPTAPPN
jgi:DNA-binding transcriptional MerR regulator